MTQLRAAGFDDLAAELIGVVDLRSGVAVHAVAGDRSQYRRVSIPDCDDAGCAESLVDHYRSLGVQRFYLADLDALTGLKVQFGALSGLIRHCGADAAVMIDVGFRGDESAAELQSLRRLASLSPRVQLIVASESVVSKRWRDAVAEVVPAGRIVLSLDYRDGAWLNEVMTESEFLGLDNPAAVRFGGAIVLDVAHVGTRGGAATAAKCRQLIGDVGTRSQIQIDAWISGGGIRTPADVRDLLAAGCQQCLVATALLS